MFFLLKNNNILNAKINYIIIIQFLSISISINFNCKNHKFNKLLHSFTESKLCVDIKRQTEWKANIVKDTVVVTNYITTKM